MHTHPLRPRLPIAYRIIHLHANPWFSGTGLKPAAQVNLICFGSSGSGGSQFLPWNRLVPDGMRVLGVQLPGREFRHREPLCMDLDALVESIASALCALAGPFAFFGHSFGALLAFETAQRLRAMGERQPLALFVAGRGAPQHALDYPRVDHLPDLEFIDVVRRFGGTDPQLLGDTAPMALFLPAIRADLHLNASYTYRPRPPLNLPIVALRGLDDPVCSLAELQPWRELTRARATLLEWEGAHFFYKDHLPRLISTFSTVLHATATARDTTIDFTEEAGVL